MNRHFDAIPIPPYRTSGKYKNIEQLAIKKSWKLQQS